MWVYKQSKIMNILFTYELNRKLQENKNNPTVNTFTPGFVPATGLGGGSKALSIIFDYILGCFHISRSLADGGDQILFLATHPSVAQTTGKYFVFFKDTPSSEESYDQTKAAELWGITENLIQPYVKN